MRKVTPVAPKVPKGVKASRPNAANTPGVVLPGYVVAMAAAAVAVVMAEADAVAVAVAAGSADRAAEAVEDFVVVVEAEEGATGVEVTAVVIMAGRRDIRKAADTENFCQLLIEHGRGRSQAAATGGVFGGHWTAI